MKEIEHEPVVGAGQIACPECGHHELREAGPDLLRCESCGHTFTRKEALKMGLFASAALMMPLQRIARTDVKVENRLPENQLPKPFQVPFAVPPVARPVRSTATTDYYRMTMKAGRARILPDLPPTEVWGYEGITPGPTIVQRRGRRTVVRHINGIHRPNHRWASVHLHGNASAPQYDGYASDVIRPEHYKDYIYPNEQDARTLWYHDHGVHDTAFNAYMGLAALYITHDEKELSLPIPHGRYDVPLVIKDATFAKNGQLIFDDRDHSDLFGDVILVNGRPWPLMKVERRKYRFRVLNASISRSYELALSTGDPLIVIGHDGGLAPHPVETHSLRIGMAERYEVVVDFANYPIGTQVVLRNLEGKENVEYPSTRHVMAFEVAGEATDKRDNFVPADLNPENEVMRLSEPEAKRPYRELEFERKHGMWAVNGRTWHDIEKSHFREIVANPGVGDVEVWRLTNRSGGWFHPVHIHLVDFKILDRDGEPPRPYEMGPKDTAYVGESETMRVLMRFEREGRYMIHCHNLVHEDHDMMSQFEVGSGGPDPIEAAPAKPVSEMRPL